MKGGHNGGFGGRSEEATGKGDNGRQSLKASEGREWRWHCPRAGAVPEGREPGQDQFPRAGNHTGIAPEQGQFPRAGN